MNLTRVEICGWKDLYNEVNVVANEVQEINFILSLVKVFLDSMILHLLDLYEGKEILNDQTG